MIFVCLIINALQIRRVYAREKDSRQDRNQTLFSEVDNAVGQHNENCILIKEKDRPYSAVKFILDNATITSERIYNCGAIGVNTRLSESMAGRCSFHNKIQSDDEENPHLNYFY